MKTTAGQAPSEEAITGRASRISVIVPTYNRCGMLRQTLESLAGQRFPSDEFEVIVADDGSRLESCGRLDNTVLVQERFEIRRIIHRAGLLRLGNRVIG